MQILFLGAVLHAGACTTVQPVWCLSILVFVPHSPKGTRHPSWSLLLLHMSHRSRRAPGITKPSNRTTVTVTRAAREAREARHGKRLLESIPPKGWKHTTYSCSCCLAERGLPFTPDPCAHSPSPPSSQAACRGKPGAEGRGFIPGSCSLLQLCSSKFLQLWGVRRGVGMEGAHLLASLCTWPHFLTLP